MANHREKVGYSPRHPNAPIRGQVARGVIPPGIKVNRSSQDALVFSSMLSGHDDESPGHELPAEPERELEILFRHIRGFVEAAGGSVNDLTTVTFFAMDDAHRATILKEWGKLFPDTKRQPPYHVLNVAPSGLRGERVEAVVVARIRR
ncbi:MAG: hypothetical protein O7B35_09785 [Deltaproteobacteria bacterium]|nr:hypothetical protein [Deltaproteobacteria bacterium]